jgi:hypothetical protein
MRRGQQQMLKIPLAGATHPTKASENKEHDMIQRVSQARRNPACHAFSPARDGAPASNLARESRQLLASASPFRKELCSFAIGLGGAGTWRRSAEGWGAAFTPGCEHEVRRNDGHCMTAVG